MKAKHRNSRAKPVELAKFENMKAMSAQCKIPYDVLREASSKGCKFARHGRCDLMEFIEWFFNQDPESEGEDAMDWTKFDKKMTGLLKKAKLDQMNEDTILWKVSELFVQHLMRDKFFGELDRLALELPVKLRGASELKVNEEVNKQTAAIKASIRLAIENWIETKGKQ